MHYGIVIIAAMGIAFFLPPVGVGLSIAAAIARVDIDDVSRSYFPYLIALLVGLALIAAFPVFTLVLPRWVFGYRGVTVVSRQSSVVSRQSRSRESGVGSRQLANAEPESRIPSLRNRKHR